jgi:hypothetical protein
MVEFNSYKTTGQGLYGNGEETYFVNKHGIAFCVQSPDLAARHGEPIKVDGYLPVDCVQLGTADTADLEIPDWVYEVTE